MMLFGTVTMQFVLSAANRDRAGILAAEAEAAAMTESSDVIAEAIGGDGTEGAVLSK